MQVSVDHESLFLSILKYIFFCITEVIQECRCMSAEFCIWSYSFSYVTLSLEWAAFILVWLAFGNNAVIFIDTKVCLPQETPAIVKSYYDKRIVGCPSGEGGKLTSSSLNGIYSKFFFVIICCFCWIFHTCI